VAGTYGVAIAYFLWGLKWPCGVSIDDQVFAVVSSISSLLASGSVLYPLAWVILLPFRLAGIAVHGALELVVALITLPARLIRAI